MPDRVSVTTSQSWLSRLAGSIKSVVFGMVLFVVGFPLLFWHEGRAAKMARSLTEGAGIVVSVSSGAVDFAGHRGNWSRPRLERARRSCQGLICRPKPAFRQKGRRK